MQPVNRQSLKATIKIDGIDEMVLMNFMKAFKEAEHNVTGDEMFILGDTSRGFKQIQNRVKAALDSAAVASAKKKIEPMETGGNNGKRKTSRAKRKTK